MRLGVAIVDTWDFFHEIYTEFQAHHEVTLFEKRHIDAPFFRERLNRRAFKRDMQKFLTTNDVIFFEWSSELLVAATQLPKTCGIVTRMHRYEMYEWVDQVDWSKVDKLIAVSQSKREEFIARFPQHAAIVEVIPEAIDLTKFQFRPKSFRGNLGILCHLRPRKRVYESILAFYELCQQRDDLHLHVGGGGVDGLHEYTVAIEQLVHKLKLQNKVTFYGHVSDNAAWYDKIDIFISNGYSEGWQVALLEAMASGCYTAVHQWAGADELMTPGELYFSDREFQEIVLAYCEMTEAERRQRVDNLRHIVETVGDMSQRQVQIRQIVEAVAEKSTTH